MIEPKPAYGHRQLIEWLFLLGFLLAFGGFIGHTQYQEYQRTEAEERLRLTQQTEVIEKNLVPQLASANKALESVRDDLEHLQSAKDGLDRINRRLKVFSETLPGVRTLLVLDAIGHITASNNATLIGANLSHRESSHWSTAIPWRWHDRWLVPRASLPA